MATIDELRRIKKGLNNPMNDLTKILIENVKLVKGDKGDKGDKGEDGYTPVKGKDYFDGKDGRDGRTPIKGVDYFDGLDGKDGKNGKNGIDGKNGKNGKDGKDGSPDTAEQVRDKLEGLKGTARLDASAIQNIEKFVNSTVKYTGGSGVERFTKLKDTPRNYDNASGRLVGVKEDESGLEFSLKVTIGDTEPVNPALNDLWIDTNI